jgi:hypothetical protein
MLSILRYLQCMILIFRRIFKIKLKRITVGYGDILPVTNPEKILCILTMIVACGVFGFVMNSVGVIF